MNRISNLVLASLMLSAAPLTANATAYIQNQITDQPLTVEYQYCNTSGYPYRCSPVIAVKIQMQSAYSVPTPAGPIKYNLLQIVSASTPDGWTYTGPGGSSCDSFFDTLPQFSNLSKSYVTDILQCTNSVGSAK